MINYKELADFFIDRECNANGITETIKLLLDYGYTEEELTELKFNKNDIERAQNE